MKVLKKYFIMPHYAQFQSHNNVGNAKISVANLMLEEISFSAAPVWSVACRGPGQVVSAHSRHLAPGGASETGETSERSHCHMSHSW